MKFSSAFSSVVAATLVAALAHDAFAAETAAAPPDAQAILNNMAKYLGSLQSFSVHVDSGYDAVQESGQKIEFLEKRDILLDRPGRLRIDTVKSDGDHTILFIDGKTVTVQSLGKNVYAQTEAKATLDETIVYFIKDLRMKLPLAMMLVSTVEKELAGRITDVDYVETTSILGQPAYHIVGDTPRIDFQFWIAAGKEPLPLRVVLTYHEEAGEPEFRARFEDWDVSPSVRSSKFAFEAPKGAQKISFINQVKPAKQVSSTGAPAKK